jgi:hypothetical protein
MKGPSWWLGSDALTVNRGEDFSVKKGRWLLPVQRRGHGQLLRQLNCRGMERPAAGTVPNMNLNLLWQRLIRVKPMRDESFVYRAENHIDLRFGRSLYGSRNSMCRLIGAQVSNLRG